MKIQPEHFAHMKTEIEKTMLHFPVAQYRAENPTFSDKRIRWDYWRAAGLLTWTCDTLYKYLNDEHIDSALRSIFSRTS